MVLVNWDWSGNISLARTKSTYVIIWKVDKPRGLFYDISKQEKFD